MGTAAERVNIALLKMQYYYNTFSCVTNMLCTDAIERVIANNSVENDTLTAKKTLISHNQLR